ncbi:MAG: 4-hydroxythreonine-4-phosphate dehydrogenase PdxA [Desulfobacterales bacterium]|nr:4-hydroxythreonine-4-phosphate dehydrogenase PdxA [Desulfobacterales bacterium]
MKSKKKIPVIGITMGDPAGIGPEITSLVISNPKIYKLCCPIVLGDINVLKKASKLLKINLKPKKINLVKDACFKFGQPDIISLSNINADLLIPGISTLENGKAMLSYINKGIELAMSKTIDGVVTSPITKTALKLAGSNFHGHTELFAKATKTTDYNMMFLGKKLKIVLVTIHIPLSEVPKNITTDKIFQTIKITNAFLKSKFDIKKPVLAVAGLNPHAGENSMFGNEEYQIIAPAIKLARKAGYNVSDPIPPDTLFYNALNNKKYDCIVCMYHDQGLIPFKMLHFDDGINTTIGLPIIRTSCDHGTAYDIAWQCIANPKSLTEAVKSAAFQAKTIKTSEKL